MKRVLYLCVAMAFLWACSGGDSTTDNDTGTEDAGSDVQETTGTDSDDSTGSDTNDVSDPDVTDECETAADCVDDNSCTEPTCDAGLCVFTALEDGSWCADGQVCQGGECLPDCGDGTCIEGEDSTTCAEDCGSSCGDGVCNGDEGTATCTEDCGTSCGDGVCNGDEDTATCTEDCGSTCGDGEVNGLEACDDGNTDDGDYCAADCMTISGSCGDGAQQDIEVCEDGNTIDGDYCSADCTEVTGACGDGVQQDNEGCDDENSSWGDGCTPLCGIENFQAGDVIVTEFMPDPSAVTDAKGEWIELYNTTDGDIIINGWSISDTAGAGSQHLISAEGLVVVPAGDYAVLAKSCSDNGGLVPIYCYETGTGSPDFVLNNDDDAIVLTWLSNIIDSINYGPPTWTISSGASMQLSNSADCMNHLANESAACWCPATEIYNDPDLGTPGAANSVCE